MHRLSFRLARSARLHNGIQSLTRPYVSRAERPTYKQVLKPAVRPARPPSTFNRNIQSSKGPIAPLETTTKLSGMDNSSSSSPLPGQVASVLTPINLVLLSFLAIIVVQRLRPAKPVTLPRPAPPIVFRTFTPPTLRSYNGENGQPIYFAVRGRVFDVSNGRNFYGPGGPYENFAGRDATRGLAMGSFDEDMLTKNLEGPLDDLKGLGPDEMEALRGWEETFNGKYIVVGRLVAVGSKEAKEAGL